MACSGCPRFLRHPARPLFASRLCAVRAPAFSYRGSFKSRVRGWNAQSSYTSNCASLVFVCICSSPFVSPLPPVRREGMNQLGPQTLTAAQRSFSFFLFHSRVIFFLDPIFRGVNALRNLQLANLNSTSPWRSNGSYKAFRQRTTVQLIARKTNYTECSTTTDFFYNCRQVVHASL